MNFFNMFNHSMHQRHNQQSTENVNNERLYKILEISKNADQNAIKKAYLKKSMKGEYRHPDKGGDKEKFQILSMAYNTLKDDKKRELYNKYGEDSLKPDFQEPINLNNLFSFNSNFSTNHHKQRNVLEKGKPTLYKLKLTLSELAKGCHKKIKLTRKVFMNSVTNRIVKENELKDIYTICQKCQGQGIINITRQIGPGMIQQIRTKCNLCHGNSKQLKKQYKKTQFVETISVYIPKGTENGDKIKIIDKGDMIPGHLTSDLFIIIEQLSDNIFQRKGNDLLIKRKISLVDALCGFEFLIKHPEDRYIVIQSKDIIKDKEIKCIENGGMPIKNDEFSYGKLFIIFKVVFPKKEEISDKITLIKQIFNNINSFNLNNNNISYEIEKIPENTEIDYGLLKDVNPELYGKKENSNTNECESDEDVFEGVNMEQNCRTM